MKKLIWLMLWGAAFYYGWQYYNNTQNPPAEEPQTASSAPAQQQDRTRRAGTRPKEEPSFWEKATMTFTGEKQTSRTYSSKDKDAGSPGYKGPYAPSQDSGHYYMTQRDADYLKGYFKKPNPPEYIPLPSGLRIHMKTVRTFYCPVRKKHFPIRAPDKAFVIAPEKPR